MKRKQKQSKVYSLIVLFAIILGLALIGPEKTSSERLRETKNKVRIQTREEIEKRIQAIRKGKEVGYEGPHRTSRPKIGENEQILVCRALFNISVVLENYLNLAVMKQLEDGTQPFDDCIRKNQKAIVDFFDKYMDQEIGVINDSITTLFDNIHYIRRNNEMNDIEKKKTVNLYSQHLMNLICLYLQKRCLENCGDEWNKYYDTPFDVCF